MAVPVWRAHHVAAPRVDTLHFSGRSGGERAAQPRLWKMCSPGDCRLGKAIPTARGSLGTKLCAVKVCVHKRQQRGGALLSLARTALLGLGKCSGHNNSFPRCFCLSMSQLVDANPYKKMAFLDSQKAKIFPAAQPWGRGVCSHRGLGPELKSLNAPPLPAPDPEPSHTPAYLHCLIRHPVTRRLRSPVRLEPHVVGSRSLSGAQIRRV